MAEKVGVFLFFPQFVSRARVEWGQLMRLCKLPLLLVASVGLSGCVDSLRSQSPSAKWTTGFWYWQGSSVDVTTSRELLDVLFVQVGRIDQDTTPYAVRGRPPEKLWHAYGQLPLELPPARKYWLVFRFERQGVPDLPAASILAQEVSRLQETARQRHLDVAGVQLDIDSPTGMLSQYASFLREVRKGLRPGLEISITALLDWFSPGTSIVDVIKETDEFVPQFYDVADASSYNYGGAIAKKINALEWQPRLNRFGKRFRIGISTFGRARWVPKDKPSPKGYGRIVFFRDATPLDLAINSAFNLQATRNEAGEQVLNYRATRQTRIGYNDFAPGDAVQFILSTPDAVRSAVESARQMLGYCAGVIFFRWPAGDETLAMMPRDVLAAADRAPQRKQPAGIHVVDGACVAVKCVDVYLVNASALSPTSLRYRIHSSSGLEYFLPEQKIPIRLLNPSELELSLPAFSARSRMYLGRAVTMTRTEFTLEEER